MTEQKCIQLANSFATTDWEVSENSFIYSLRNPQITFYLYRNGLTITDPNGYSYTILGNTDTGELYNKIQEYYHKQFEGYINEHLRKKP